MDRRAVFLGSLAMFAAGVPLPAVAQGVRKIFRVGILGFSGSHSGPTGPQPADRSTAAFLGGCARSATGTVSIS